MKKEYPARNTTCSFACGRKVEAERRKASAPHEITLADRVREVLKRQKAKPIAFPDLCDAVNQGPRVVREAITSLRETGYNVSVFDSAVRLDTSFAENPKRVALTHDLSDYQGKWIRFGVVGDKHLGNMHARLDVLKLLYDLYESEGIGTVYDTGNWIDGEARFNKGELLVHGMDAQLDYWIENHPQRKGITTYYVAGDDHEGWYQQRECLEIGKYAMLRAQDQGRADLRYLGYAEALIELKAAHGSRFMMVNHPGGGAAYAISYKGQKYVESLQGGEKPAIVLQGHYHKANLSYPREVFVVDTATCCDQTLFMRKRQIHAHVGGWIIELLQAPDGRITRFRGEFLPFYDRGFYEDQRRRFGLPGKLKRAA
ncbi:MAG: hypothetical protein KGL39_45205 [Patescibacteria group bacterium]|nr:hypothetical protein [Patescibacteria group bacterium]